MRDTSIAMENPNPSSTLDNWQPSVVMTMRLVLMTTVGTDYDGARCP